MDRNLALEAVRVTEAAALAAGRFVGSGDEEAADRAAVAAVQEALDGLLIDGTVVVGEGYEDEAPALYVGQKVGAGNGVAVDIALDPLEGATIVANGANNALAIVAMGGAGAFLNVPDIYMDKIAVGGQDLPRDLIDLDEPPAGNLRNVAKAKRMEVSDLLVCILDRPRHEELIAQVREAGAHVMLITDGDVSGIIATALPEPPVHLYMGSGGAPQGILAAAALRCIGGAMQARLVVRGDDDRARARRCGIDDWGRKYQLEEMVQGPVMVSVTGVTDGTIVRGVRRVPGGAVTHSLVMRSKTGTLRYIEARHDFERKSRACGQR